MLRAMLRREEAHRLAPTGLTLERWLPNGSAATTVGKDPDPRTRVQILRVTRRQYLLTSTNRNAFYGFFGRATRMDPHDNERITMS